MSRQLLLSILIISLGIEQSMPNVEATSLRGDLGAIVSTANAFVQNYLQKYGYMTESHGSANLIAESSFRNAIRSFQRFAGLNDTGNLDSETVRMMGTPRCGNKDRAVGDDARRKKRYALQGSKWRRTELTYRISKYPKKFKKSIVDKEIARAFELWSDVTPLNFVHKKDGRVHIDIRFVTGEHGDGDPFDGPGSTLAHAYFPQYGGDAHFDDEEHWSVNSYVGTNLFQVAAHELGHSLGLGHSSIRESLMAPFYQRYKPNFKLHKDDILGIQSLYGESSPPNAITTTSLSPTTGGSFDRHPTTEKPTMRPSNNDEPGGAEAELDLCQSGSIDAVTRVSSGRTFVFKGDYYWKVETSGLADGYPRRISQDWDGLPGNIDAVVTWADGKTFFFKGDKYWRFHDMRMDPGYPKEISVGFAGIPNNVDTAFVWSGNGKTYFFKGSLYWRFDSKTDPPVSNRYPKPIKNWIGLPNNLDAAFKWENGLTYFFKGNEYYRFNDVDFEVDTKAKPPFPRQTSVWWFDCKSASHNSYRSRRKLISPPLQMPGWPRTELAEIMSRASSHPIVFRTEPRIASSALESSPLTVDEPRPEWTDMNSQLEFDSSAPMAAYQMQSSAQSNWLWSRSTLISVIFFVVWWNRFLH